MSGVLLFYVIPFDEKKPTFLQVLDALDLSELATAEISADIQVPFSFHGSFVSQSPLSTAAA